jgi:hypothetical protein
MSGREEFVPEPANTEMPATDERPQFTLREPSGDALSDVRPQKLHPERLRPRLDARHSYAGQPRDTKDATPEPVKTNERPAGLRRSFTYAPGGPTAPGHVRRVLLRIWSLVATQAASTLARMLQCSLFFGLSTMKPILLSSLVESTGCWKEAGL